MLTFVLIVVAIVFWPISLAVGIGYLAAYVIPILIAGAIAAAGAMDKTTWTFIIISLMIIGFIKMILDDNKAKANKNEKTN